MNFVFASELGHDEEEQKQNCPRQTAEPRVGAALCWPSRAEPIGRMLSLRCCWRRPIGSGRTENVYLTR